MNLPTQHPNPRPAAVTTACTMAIIGAATLSVAGLGILALHAVPGQSIATLPVGPAIVATPGATTVSGVVFLAIAAAVITLAIRTRRRHRAALYALLTVGALSIFIAVLGLVNQQAGPTVVLPILYIGVTSAMLWQHRRWFSPQPPGADMPMVSR